MKNELNSSIIAVYYMDKKILRKVYKIARKKAILEQYQEGLTYNAKQIIKSGIVGTYAPKDDEIQPPILPFTMAYPYFTSTSRVMSFRQVNNNN